MRSPFPGMNPYLENPELWPIEYWSVGARFEMAIDYTQEAVPPLKEEDKVWAAALLKERGFR